MYRNADFDSANATLHYLSSGSVPAKYVDSLWSQWSDTFMTTMSQFILSKVIKQNPWRTNSLTEEFSRKMLKLFKDAKRYNSEHAWMN